MRVSSLSHSFAVAITFICCLDIAVALSAGSRAAHHQHHGHRVKRHTKCSNATTAAGSLAYNGTASASKAYGLTTSSTASSSAVLQNGIGNAVNGSAKCQAAVSVVTTTTTSTIRETITVTAGATSGPGQGYGSSGEGYRNATTTSKNTTSTSKPAVSGTGTPNLLGYNDNQSTGNGTWAGNSTIAGSTSVPTTKSSLSTKRSGSTSTTVGSTLSASGSALGDPVGVTTTSSAIFGYPTGSTSTSNSSDSNSGSSSNSTDLTPTDNSDNGSRPASQGFWAGAGIDTVARMTQIEGRTIYDYDGKTVKDPYVILAESKFNAFRLETFPTYSVEEQPVDHTNEDSKELNFQLDWGSLATQTKAARKIIDAGLKKFQLTINMGTKIPADWADYSYVQMIDAIKKETKRQLQPFLDAKILPDIILFENEGSWGMLYEDADGHSRGNKDDGKSTDQVNDELCGRRPTGTVGAYPQLAGYYKAEAQACTEAITAAGLDISKVRYGLHSHVQYIDFKQSAVYNTDDPDFEKTNKDTTGKSCDYKGIIPDDLLNASAADMLDIMGFSAYPDPMTPTDMKDDTSLYATFGRLNKTLELMNVVVERYGRYENGPFKGQYKKQALGVEYATNFGKTDDGVIARSRHTQMMWDIVKPQEFFLGMLWYEPWYCIGNWEGGDAALCDKSFENGGSQIWPVDTMKVWGARARSPWN
ncbi:MAG: hypothetical protein M1812_004153 [Candelaria pacifica]|nr:MAG: hypothetical protein M1812_004153 [Candelaria pacifica]